MGRSWVRLGEQRVSKLLARSGCSTTQRNQRASPEADYIRTVKVRLKLMGCLKENPFGTASRAGEL
jgi:hypothetical protein